MFMYIHSIHIYIYTMYIHSICTLYSQRKITILAPEVSLGIVGIFASSNPYVGDVAMITLCYPRVISGNLTLFRITIEHGIYS